MKLSLEWLGDYVKWSFGKAQDYDANELARILTAHVAEVDAVEEQGALLRDCVIGKVISLQKHPNADKLSVCDVKTDKGVKRVVCGGTNLREGMRVVFAHVGATVQHGDEILKLEKIKIRGEASEGMICAADEVGLPFDLAPFVGAQGRQGRPDNGAGERPIVDLGDEEEGVGKPAREFFGFTDTTIFIDNHAITNRPDLFSHIGFARECVALGLGTWKKKPDFKPAKFSKAPIPFKFDVKDVKLMPRYCACMIHIDGLGETPNWMKRRLEATGWRPISLPIDITNYVMMEVGVPLHSFDADDIKGTVSLRQAKKGEKMITLDGKERGLSEGALILADQEGIFDLLGIMGGLRSSTKESTRSIYLHSASLDPVSVRKAMIAMGHRTDAGTTYEKGVPPVTAEQGFYRAVELFLELVPSARIASVMDDHGKNGTPKALTLHVARCNAILGTDLKATQIKKILTDLGFKVTRSTRSARSGQAGAGDKLAVTPPLWRLGDIKGEQDLAEEVGRIYGYNKIKAVMPEASIVPPARDPRLNQIRCGLWDDAFTELVPLSLVGPDLLRKAGFDAEQTVAVENPLGEELSRLQPSTLPRLLEQVEMQARQAAQVCTFAVAKVFSAKAEHLELGMLFAATGKTDLLHDPFLHLKSSVESALKRAGYSVTVQSSREKPVASHPGRIGEVVVGGSVVGHLFEIHPAIRARFGLPQRAAAALIGLDALFAIKPEPIVFKPLPQFPAVTYDETVPMRQDQSVAALLSKMRAASKLLESVEVADLFSKEGSESYNLTLRFTYRSPERTLTEAEVKQEHGKVMVQASR